MIELCRDQLTFSFPEVHSEARCTVSFQRTLRIPDDGREHFLPPGLGRFPLEQVDDYADRLPAKWKSHGGVFMPMYQAEALWISFGGRGNYPMAIKVAAGKVDAVTGEPFTNDLSSSPQNYAVVPGQRWLDGFSVKKGRIRQFVAMPLGEGYTAEEQLTGKAEHGGLQLVVIPMKAGRYEPIRRERLRRERLLLERLVREPRLEQVGSPFPNLRFRDDVPSAKCVQPMTSMGLAPGGMMRQEIYEDRHGPDVWHPEVRSRCFVHLPNSAQYRDATGYAPPNRPPRARDYTRAGLPWFDYYDEDRAALEGAPRLRRLESVGARRVREGKPLDDEDVPTPSRPQIHPLGPNRRVVSDGDW